MRKKITALLTGLIICLLDPLEILAVTGETRVSLNPANVEIVDVSEKDEDTEEGNVPEVTVYEDIEVSTAQDMIELSLNCRLDTWSVGKRIILMNDISLYDTDFVTIPTFGGYFEGQGYSIKGITAGEEVSFVGLFNYTQPTAVIANLNVEGVLQPAGSPMVVGGIVSPTSSAAFAAAG